jgi:hypothetical protein
VTRIAARTSIVAFAAVLLAVFVPLTADAQGAAGPGAAKAAAPTQAIPFAPQPGAATGSERVAQPRRSLLTMSAKVTDDGQPIRAGLVWRVMRENPARVDGDEKLQLVAVSSGGDAEFLLEPGSYLVHAAYGRAAATARLNLDGQSRAETLILYAAGLKLTAALPGDKPLADDLVTFDIYSLDNDQKGDRQAIVLGAKPGKVVRLNADTYRIIGHYGDVNATARAEIKLTPGKLTEATMYMRAARVTFKLVSAPGGEALTNVSWSVVSRGGDPLTRVVGAYPTVALAEGEYSIIAKQGEQVFTRNFTVESGYDREIEVTAR